MLKCWKNCQSQFWKFFSSIFWFQTDHHHNSVTMFRSDIYNIMKILTVTFTIQSKLRQRYTSDIFFYSGFAELSPLLLPGHLAVWLAVCPATQKLQVKALTRSQNFHGNCSFSISMDFNSRPLLLCRGWMKDWWVTMFFHN